MSKLFARTIHLRYGLVIGPLLLLMFVLLEKSYLRVYAIIGLTIELSLILWLVPKWQLTALHEKEVDAIKLAEIEDSYRKTLAQIIGGLLLLCGLYATWNTIVISQRTLDLAREGQINERFSRAVANLAARDQNGEIILETRLAGIFALEQIAKESEQYYLQIMAVFEAYIRENAKRTFNAQKSTKAKKVRSDIKEILFIFNRMEGFNHKYSPYVDLSGTDLRNAILKDHKFNHSDFSHSDLSMAELEKTTFVYSNLSHINLEQTSLGLSKESKYYRDGKEDIEAMAKDGTDFTFGTLQGANLRNATLIGTKFGDISLDGVDFEGAYFRQVYFKYVDLSTVKGLTCEQLAESYICETKLPAYVQHCKFLKAPDCKEGKK